MQRSQALGLIVLMSLSAQSGIAAEAKKNTANQQSPETQQQIQQAQKDAEALRQRAQAAQEEARRLEAEQKAAEQKLQNAQQQYQGAQQQLQGAQQQLQGAQQQYQGAQQQVQDAQQQVQAAQEKKATGPEPSLNLPIRYYVYTALLSGVGYATGFLSRGPERDLRDPAKHPTQDKTLSIYRRAYYGGLVSKGFYSLSGTVGAYAAYKTQSSIRQYITAKAQAQMAQRQREAAERLAQASSAEQKKAAEVTNSLLVPSEPESSEPVALLPEPPPLQIGLGVGPSGGGAFSLSFQF